MFLLPLAQGHLAGQAGMTGVYVGVSQLEYAGLGLQAGTPLNAYYATGSHLSAASGRISFTFGLKGPAITVGATFCCVECGIVSLCDAVQHTACRSPHFALVFVRTA